MLRVLVLDDVAALRCIEDCLATDSPKPPRVMVLVTAGLGAMAVLGTFMVRPVVAEPKFLPVASTNLPFAGLLGAFDVNNG